MPQNTTSKNALFFDSIDKIPENLWAELGVENDSYLSSSYLKCIEKNHTGVIFSYMFLLNSSNKPIAFANLQIVDFYLDGVNDSFRDTLLNIKKLLRKIGIFPDKKPIKLLISGNLFVSGEHGIFIQRNQDKRQVVKSMAKAFSEHLNQDKKLVNSIDAFMLKDFLDESLFISNELKRFNYHPFSVEPNMRLNLNPSWKNFDDYLGAMKTKFRVKARKAIQQSAALTAKNIDAKEIKVYLPEMISLYKKVANSATFNLTHFNLQTYIDLKEKFKENYLIKAYFLDDKMVGFLSGLKNLDSLDAHFVGIDYKYNRTYAIYQRMLYDYIEHAIQQKLKGINFGRTASEIKSSVGAEPENLTIYLRHKKRFTNKLLKLFLFHVQPTPFHQKFPFKNNPNEKQ